MKKRGKRSVSRETTLAVLLIIVLSSVVTGAHILTEYIEKNQKFSVCVAEQQIGIAASIDDADLAMRSAVEKISENIGTVLPALPEVSIERIYLSDSANSVGELSDSICSAMLSEKVTAYSMYLDGIYVATAASREVIENSIERVAELYENGRLKVAAKDESEANPDGISECRIANDVDIVPVIVRLCEVTGEEKLLACFGCENVNDDSFMYSDVETYTPQAALSPRKRTEGEAEINAEQGSIFSFDETKRETILVDVPYETVYVYSDELAQGISRKRTNGESGRTVVVSDVTYSDGRAVERKAVEKNVLLEAKNEIIYVGTYKRRIGESDKYGRFTLPCFGTLTSAYGERNIFGADEKHTGCDIAAPNGSEITAADEGLVTVAGDCGNGYGIYVVLDHGDGYATLYAHMRSTSVKVGERVLQGQKLGEVGLTGRTTGYHLHFEVRKDGSPLNPEVFVRLR